jgi:hypothetical protein
MAGAAGPFVRRGLRAENAIALALAIGLGFGIGELWFLAQQVAGVPAYAEVPFYAFTGFLGERFAVCFLHGAFIAYAVRQLAEHRSFLLGGALGVVLHFGLNFPIFLMANDVFGLGKEVWATLQSLWFAAMIVALLIWVSYLSRGRLLHPLLGTATCPECKAVYQRPLLALNFGVTRYERCPHCGHYHWVRIGGH